MFFHLLGVFAQWEREEITERVNASVLIRAKLGKTINGKAPYGYEWKDRKLVIVPEEAAVRRKAYELFLQHRRKGHVAQHLNTAGYRTRQGFIWRDTTILRVLEEPSAKGVYFFNTVIGNGWNSEPKPENEWGKVECDPIVSKDLWDQVNRILEEQTKSFKKPGKPPVHLFSGLAHCTCGHKMYVKANNPKYFCRSCRNKIPIVDLENIIQQELKGFFSQPARITKHLEEADRNLVEKFALLETHRHEIQKVRDEMARTHKLYLAEQITAQGFGDFYKPAEVRLNQLVAELPRLEADVDFLKVNKLSAADVVHEAETLHERWPKLPSPEKRKIIEALIEKIVIGDGEIDIMFSHLPSSKELCKTQQQLTPKCG
jgi:site-specific DNA recombinase